MPPQTEGKELTKEEKQRLRKEKKQQKKNKEKNDEKTSHEGEKKKNNKKKKEEQPAGSASQPPAQPSPKGAIVPSGADGCCGCMRGNVSRLCCACRSAHGRLT